MRTYTCTCALELVHRILPNNASTRQATIYSQNTCGIESLNQTYWEMPGGLRSSQCKANKQLNVLKISVHCNKCYLDNGSASVRSSFSSDFMQVLA